MLIDFDVHWEPIVSYVPRRNPRTAYNMMQTYHRVVAGRIIIVPPHGQDLDAWWADRVADGQVDSVPTHLFARTARFEQQMQKVWRWHVPLHPQSLPATRDFRPGWNLMNYSLTFDHELPIDCEVDPQMWAELAMIEKQPSRATFKPRIIGTQVGRSEPLSVELAEQLNAGPFGALILDRSITDGFTTSAMPTDDPNWARVDAISQFCQAVRPNLPIIAEHVENEAAWNLLRAAGIEYMCGSYVFPPTPFTKAFQEPKNEFDPIEYPDYAKPDADDWAWTQGLDFVGDENDVHFLLN